MNCQWRRSEKHLGKGAYGEVWLGMGMEGTLVAIKTIELQIRHNRSNDTSHSDIHIEQPASTSFNLLRLVNQEEESLKVSPPPPPTYPRWKSTT